MRIKTGDIVVRSIEGMEFEATVLEVNQKSATVTLEYLDDGNTESDVPFDEIQEIIEGKSDSISQSMSKNVRKIETLAKPLFGLVEDDHEIRKNHQPKIIIHEVLGEDDGKAPIILNGAENKLAAGGGLRALRYLKK
jgi:hypothetical protein